MTTRTFTQSGGSLYLEQGQPSEALRDLEKALKLAPDDSELLTNRAQVYRQFGQIAQALDDLNRAIELNPDLVAARFNRGAIHYSSEEFKMSDAISAKNTTRYCCWACTRTMLQM